ncbi:MAG: hypothetical protein VXY93_15720, partial [Pseudomonadota bacterium]|nr:hypothetical protein [Pseudomonadota bacterium]
GAGLSVVGIVTTQKDIHVGAGLSVVGVATFSDHIILKGTNPRITFTDTDSNPDFQIYGSGGNLNIWDATNNASRLLINADGHIDVGHLDVLNGLSVGGNATFANDIDVDGHTNLDNVSIAGVTTIANNKELVFGEQADSQYNTLIKQIPSGSTGSLSVTTRFPRIYAHDTRIIDIDNGNTQAYFWPNQISLFATGNERLQITGSGIKVFGTADGHGILLDNTTNRNNITAESNRSGANNSI